MPKTVHFGEFLKIWSLQSNSVTRQVNFNTTKIGEKCQKSEIQMQHLSGQKVIKNAKYGLIWRVLENLKFAVKQCYQIYQFE